jgi:hypothetical protein
MRRRHHEIADGIELAKRELEGRRALQRGDRLQLVLCGGMCGRGGDKNNQAEKNFAHFDRSMDELRIVDEPTSDDLVKQMGDCQSEIDSLDFKTGNHQTVTHSVDRQS